MRQLGSNLRQCFLSSNPEAVTDDMLDELQNQGIFTLGLNKDLIVQGNASNHIISVSKDLIDKIHARGMELTLYTFRNEFDFLYFDYGQDPYEEYQFFFDLGIDGFFTEFPSSLNRFLRWKEQEYYNNDRTTTTPQSMTTTTKSQTTTTWHKDTTTSIISGDSSTTTTNQDTTTSTTSEALSNHIRALTFVPILLCLSFLR